MNRTKIQLLASAALILLMCAWSLRAITGAPIESDGAGNLRMALNFAHEGTISGAEEAPFTPSMYREPFPILVLAGVVRVSDAFLGRAADEQYFSGERARVLKLHNVGWLLLLLTGVFAAIRQLTGNTLLGCAGCVLVLLKVPATPTSLGALAYDTLETDLAAAAMLLWGSIFLMRAVQRRRLGCFLAAGLCFGALALTKAAFLYIFAGVVLGTAVLGWLWPRSEPAEPPVRGAVCMLVLAAGFAAVAVPWMLRNHATLDTFAIAQRGGLVLLFRAEKNLMSPEEYRGSFYVWAPRKLVPLVGSVLGYTREDTQRGGRLQRLNRAEDSDFYADDYAAELSGRPDAAISYYHKVRAQRIELGQRLGRSPEAQVRVDAILQARAMELIRAHPGRHVAATLPFLWRGAFTIFPLLLIALLYALWRRRSDLAVFLLPAFGLIMFYALLSHFTPRYSVPALGTTLVAGVLLLSVAARGLLNKLSRAPAGVPRQAH